MGFVDVGLFSGLTVRRGGRFVCCKDGNGVEGDFGRREEGLEEERHGLKEVKRSESGSVDRPRLVLTRRVTAESFRGRGNGQRDAMISRALPLTLRRSDASSVSSSASSSFATSLQREEALYAFFVEAGGVGEMYNLPTPRRSADPPQRFLEINFGFVLPGSRQSFNCSNPRVTGTLRQWYEVAHSWGLLRHELREVLTLGEDRRKSVNRDVLQRPMNREPTKSTGRFSRLLRNSEALRPSLREPRVIAIGDVHGCIDELQNLLRLVDYRPGDQVIFLGDLVAKGPDSVSVVQLAREINARSVRGNHDHEVVKWREAVNRGERPPLVSLEHYRIARSLSAEDQEWLRACPWYISAPDMGFLFVHAGFIPGTRLSHQNPRLMMNMRSVLMDGTVTAKHVLDKEWARLWPGPETVVFGHDAFRGLQQHPYAYGIDTGCVYGGRLTALLLPENRFVSVEAKRQYVQPPKGWTF